MSDPSHAFTEILQRYERPLVRYAFSFTADLEDARDVVQDVFIKLHHHLAGLDEDHIAPWLFTVCKNRALDHHRKNSRIISMDTETLELEASSEPGPSEEMETRETAATLRQLIGELPDRQREAVRLKFIAGLDYKQISEAMKTSMGNVGYLIHHGVESLRKRWQSIDPEAALAISKH
ncbi:MAG: sigma-70 family RNA polymerase sigma factor [Verrucomicrobiales bacterium]|nr:sigma-70 family RNA polymerase sigma factor [Verrucomicrobiales bacterium]MCP5559145.1 sigma-70 family RNA polymerase sigma factor [Verrucomicrobiaceae bacterium]